MFTKSSLERGKNTQQGRLHLKNYYPKYLLLEPQIFVDVLLKIHLG